MFKRLAGIDAWPDLNGTKDNDEIVRRWPARAFSADSTWRTSRPAAAGVERRLTSDAGHPGFSDDQHGTSIGRDTPRSISAAGGRQGDRRRTDRHGGAVREGHTAVLKLCVAGCGRK